jgi:hypothetical protein
MQGYALKTPIDYKNHCGVPYSDASLNQDLKRLRRVWDRVQHNRARDAIYDFLAAVFELIEWWAAEGQELQRAERALHVTGTSVPEKIEPFSAVLAACLAPDRLDRRHLSRYARVLQFAAAGGCRTKTLKAFIRRHGGFNGCVAKLSRRHGARRRVR